jgi:hypothetical protein
VGQALWPAKVVFDADLAGGSAGGSACPTLLPHLRQLDIELLNKLYQFTPNVTVLLTKVDLLAPEERSEVLSFVTERLAKAFERAPQVAPYSRGHKLLKTGPGRSLDASHGIPGTSHFAATDPI